MPFAYKFLPFVSGAIILLTLTVVLPARKKQMNVLFIIADDLRPQIGAYLSKNSPFPAPKMYTPNLDALAARSLLFERAYVQQALCGPSRTSFLTGRRPDTSHAWAIPDYFRRTGGNFTTIPQFFKENGYHSIGIGKVFHPGKKASNNNDPISWTEPVFLGKPNFEKKTSWDAIPDHLLKETPLIDQQTSERTIETLRRLAPGATQGNQPFFLAFGLRRPHLPFVFPKSYLKYYPEADLPMNPYPPSDMPELAWYSCLRLYHYVDIDINPKHKKLTDDQTRALRRAYYSSVTYIDKLIGNVLDELERLGLKDNTIVVFLGDHGYQLGEHGAWCKQSNFELATHAPFMIHIPGKTDKGSRTRQLVEMVDIFPTLVEASGLGEMPLCPRNSSKVNLCREGSSLLPLVNNPDQPIKTASFSQYPRKDYMGYSIRTDRYRYTEWPRFHQVPKWSTVSEAELYDHKIDPQENVNRAYLPEYANVRRKLSKMLRAGWRNADGTENIDVRPAINAKTF